MTSSLFTSLQETASNIVEEALGKGLDATHNVRLKLLGSTLQGPLTADTRMVTVAYSQPAVPKYGCELWCDATSRLIYKSDPVAQKWNLIQQKLDMFTDYSAGVSS